MKKKEEKSVNKEKREFYLVDRKILPSALQKVIEVNKIIETENVSKYEATMRVGLSRSTYYKYADFIKPFYEENRDVVLNLYLSLEDKPGVLSRVLDLVAASNLNILTIIQNIPINGTAYATLSVHSIKGGLKKTGSVLESIRGLDGVKDIRIIGNI